MGDLLNEHDETKRMIDLLRETYTNQEGKDTIEVEGSDLDDAQQELEQQVKKTAKIVSFNIYPQTENAVMTGKIESMDNLQFQFTLEDDDGVYLIANNMQLSSDAVEVIKRLQAHYLNWVDKWTDIVREY